MIMGMKVNGTSGLTFPDTTTLASAGQSSVRAWVNFNGTGTVAIRAAYNVTSISDNGTGDYTVNFTTAMPDVDYAIVGGAVTPGSLSGFLFPYSTWGTTTSARVAAVSTAFGFADCTYVSVAIFR